MHNLIWILFVFFLTVCGSKNNAQLNNAEFQVSKDHANKEVVVFVYHRFGNSKYPSTNISVEDFENHLKYLSSNSYKILNFGEAVEYINDPEQPYSEKVACITIDDGFKSFKSNGMRLLKKYRYSATLFINSESVGGGTYLSWDELKEIHQQGIEIGNHSHSHAYFLNTKDEERLKFFKNDIMKCQEEIEAHLGFTPSIFAYPYGEFDPEMKAALKELGFKAAAAQNSGVMYRSDNFAIPRFPMAGPFVKLKGFIEKANMKALRIVNNNHPSFVLDGKNPPELIVEFDASSADLTRHNCFTSGECNTTRAENSISIRASKELTNRRTLYTITAPSKKGNRWHWFSHLWIRPDIPE